MSDAVIANDEQARYWAEQAGMWLDVEAVFEEVAGPLGALAMDRLGAEPGWRVLDVGCGSGPTTLELARRVPDGQVVGLDIAQELLDDAIRRAGDQGVGNVSFVRGDAQVHPFEPGAFDAAYSRFGVMFFADPQAAFANIRTALRPGGVLSFVSWQHVFANEWIIVPALAAAQVIGELPTPPAADEPGPFRLSDPDEVASLLAAAGFAAIEVLPYADEVAIDEGRVPLIAATSMRLGAVREMIEEVDDATRDRVREAIENALRERVRDGVLRLSRAVLLVTGRA